MPLPERRRDEEKDEFISRCMSDEQMEEEFPDREQRFAICNQRAEE